MNNDVELIHRFGLRGVWYGELHGRAWHHFAIS
jgi:hypothetical protein